MGFQKIWIWAFVIGFGLFMFSVYSGQKQKWNFAEQLVIETTAVFQKLITRTVRTTERVWTHYFILVNVQEENRRLKRQVELLRGENGQYRELLAAYKRLQSILKFRQGINRPTVAAQVIGLDPSAWFKSIIIDKGARAGIRLDMPVVNADGLVGRVVSVSPNYSKILLIIDQNSAVDCIIQRSRGRGIVKGLSSEICKLEYVFEPNNVVTGDALVTSGLAGVYPKGLLVGRVTSVKEPSTSLFEDITVKPAVDFSKLEEVLVILEEKKSSGYLKNRG